MRYTCNRCGSWVKDKFIFGTLHICATDAEVMARQFGFRDMYEYQAAASRAIAAQQSIPADFEFLFHAPRKPRYRHAEKPRLLTLV